jgi:hypothetical protein
MTYFGRCPFCKVDTEGNHQLGCPGSNIKIIDGTPISIDFSGVTNQALLSVAALQQENKQLQTQNRAMREALKQAESRLKTIEQATEYVKPGTGVWHTVGIALQEIHKALYNSADEFGPVNLNSVEPDKVIIPHNPADVEALKQAREALTAIYEESGDGGAKDCANDALMTIAEVMGE